MLTLARSNVAQTVFADRVEFRSATLPAIPMDDESVDVVISNCVLNLLPDVDKPTVWSEIWRVLRRGGRVVISDVLARKKMPDEMKRDAALLVGCVAGAAGVEETEGWLSRAGFKGLQRAQFFVK